MVKLELPFPPSVNHIWRRGKQPGSVYLDPKYKAWRKHADQMILLARQQGSARIWGPFSATITLDSRQRRKNSDADNRVKVCLDALQRMKVIDDDSLAQQVTVRWGDSAGACVELSPWPA